ncbi:MAG: hypothetical protein HC905_01315 [Bacteroidales bacterium]|nr:hypothetical protein [Bacteroidales bacterium]
MKQVKLNSPKKKVVAIDLLQEIYAFFKPITDKKGVELIIHNDFPEDHQEFLTDKVKLLQILTNLINNAIKFTEKGFIKISASIQDNFFQFEVRDSGCGISKENLSLIFDRFRQIEGKEGTIQGGTGLGLAICKAYIELIGGKIAVFSEPFVGSTFIFTWPFKEIPKNSLI